MKKALTFPLKTLTNKQLNKLVTQCGYRKESDLLQGKNIFPGDKVMIRVLPKEKSILKARYEGPFEVKIVKGAGNVVVVENQFGRQLVRNRSHVKPIRYTQEQEEKTELKRHYQKNSIGASSILNRRANSQDVPNAAPRYPSRNRIPVNRYVLNFS